MSLVEGGQETANTLSNTAKPTDGDITLTPRLCQRALCRLTGQQEGSRRRRRHTRTEGKCRNFCHARLLICLSWTQHCCSQQHIFVQTELGLSFETPVTMAQVNFFIMIIMDLNYLI